MHISELKQSKYLKKEDAGPGILVTVKEVTQENVAKEGAEPEYKYIVHFDDAEKGMVLNNTNGQLFAKILGSEESDDWIGTKVVLYEDPSITFGGKLVGGIRVRAQRNVPTAPKAATPPPARQQQASLPVRQSAPAPVQQREPGDDNPENVPF